MVLCSFVINQKNWKDYVLFHMKHKKKYGNEMAYKIHQRIDEIKASENVEILVQYRIGRCHPLHNENNNKRKRTNQ